MVLRWGSVDIVKALGLIIPRVLLSAPNGWWNVRHRHLADISTEPANVR